MKSLSFCIIKSGHRYCKALIKQRDFIAAVCERICECRVNDFVYFYCPCMFKMRRLVVRHFGCDKVVPVFTLCFINLSLIYISIDNIISMHDCFTTDCLIAELRLYIIHALLHCTNLSDDMKKVYYFDLVNDLGCIIR